MSSNTISGWSDSSDNSPRSGWGARAAIGVAILTGAVAALSLVKHPSPVRPAAVLLGGQEFRLEVADTIAAQRRGLAGRREIPENGGMVFVFPSAEERTFWMKGMRVPIDIIWLRDNRIIGMERYVSVPAEGVPDDALPRYRSSGPSDRVIELRAGRAEEIGLSVGQRVEIRLP